METDYGFIWDQVEVVRICHIKDQKVLEVKTAKESLIIRITKTGLIRVENLTKSKPPIDKRI